MLLLAALVFLPTWAVALIGVAIITFHNGLDFVPAERLRELGWPFVILFRPGMLEFPPGVQFLAMYSIVPWFGILAAGYGFGTVWLLEKERRHRVLLGLGTILTLLFVVLRTLNGYGDPRPWSVLSSPLLTFLSFLDCTKYPPSLVFVSMTIGPAILALACFDRPTVSIARPFVIFGRVPLFFYLLHVPLIHLVSLAFAWFRYGDASFLLGHLAFSDRSLFPVEYGYPLPVIYLVWILVVLCLYPPCRWFAGVKERRRDAWLSYL
jgi:uncharacterized membrane protein